MNKLYSKMFYSMTLAMLISLTAHADQDDRYDYQAEIKQQEINQASNASFDKRLPPVLPGEVLNDGQGKTKVWSTAGSLNEGAAPQAQVAPQIPQNNIDAQNALIGGVIVDDRAQPHRGNRR